MVQAKKRGERIEKQKNEIGSSAQMAQMIQGMSEQEIDQTETLREREGPTMGSTQHKPGLGALVRFRKKRGGGGGSSDAGCGDDGGGGGGEWATGEIVSVRSVRTNTHRVQSDWGNVKSDLEVFCREFETCTSRGEIVQVGTDGYKTSDGRCRVYRLTDEKARRMGASLLAAALATETNGGAGAIRDAYIGRRDVKRLSRGAFAAFAHGITSLEGLETLTLERFRGGEGLQWHVDGEEDLQWHVDNVTGMLTKRNNPLEKIAFLSCRLPSPNVLEALMGGSRVRSVELRDCCLMTAFQKDALERSIPRNTILNAVRLKYCSLDTVAWWIRFLAGRPSLEEISILNITSKGFQEDRFLENFDRIFLARPPAVVQRLAWDVNSAGVAPGLSDEFLHRLCGYDAVVSLDLVGREIGAGEAAQVERLLRKTNRLRELKLPRIRNSAELDAISRGLRCNHTLESLSLSLGRWNREMQVEKIVSALEGSRAGRNKTIRALVLAASDELQQEEDGAWKTVRGAQFLASRLVRLQGLQRLDLRGCFRPQNDHVFRELWTALEARLSLSVMYWDDQNTSRETIRDVDLCCRINSRLNRHLTSLLESAAEAPRGFWSVLLASVSRKASSLHLVLHAYPAIAERQGKSQRKRRL